MLAADNDNLRISLQKRKTRQEYSRVFSRSVHCAHPMQMKHMLMIFIECSIQTRFQIKKQPSILSWVDEVFGKKQISDLFSTAWDDLSGTGVRGKKIASESTRDLGREFFTKQVQFWGDWTAKSFNPLTSTSNWQSIIQFNYSRQVKIKYKTAILEKRFIPIVEQT